MTSQAYLHIEEPDLKMGGAAPGSPKKSAAKGGKGKPASPAKGNELTELAKHADGLKMGQDIHFTFNPKEFSVSASAQFAGRAQPGKDGGKAEFVGAAPRQMSVTVFLDSSSSDVGESVSTLLRCCNATKKSLEQGKPSPPKVTFVWGWVSSISWFVESAQAQLKMFNDNGQPIRATVQLTLKETPSSAAGQNPTSGTEDLFRSHRVVSGDSLPSVAFENYGDPTLWRRVAEASGVDDPLRIAPGLMLRLPVLAADGWEA